MFSLTHIGMCNAMRLTTFGLLCLLCFISQSSFSKIGIMKCRNGIKLGFIAFNCGYLISVSICAGFESSLIDWIEVISIMELLNLI